MRAFLLFTLVILFTANGIAQQGYSINIKLSPLKNSRVYLYNYYGKDRYQVADSAMLNDKSEGVFKGAKKLPGGIYLIVTDKRVRLFDVLMDETQRFSIVADTSRPDKPIITGSKENTLYQEYARYLEQVGPKLNALQQQYNGAKTKQDSTTAQQQIIATNKQLQDYRDNIVKTHPASMLAAFFNAMKKPEAPAMPKKADGTLDSTYPYRYVSEHFWDDVEFNDERLVRTPFFEPKLDEYFRYYVSPDADTIIDRVKYMLLYARDGKEMYRYLLAKFTNKYINPEIMGQDKVFVYLFENHYLKGGTSILTDKDKKTVMDRGWSLIANQLGEPAPPMNLVTKDNKPSALYDLKSPYTLVVFWDPNCGHCKETLPKIDSIYRAKWKAAGLKVYAVNVDESVLKAWNDFISTHKLEEWNHAYQTKSQRDAESAAGKPNFRQLYDVFKTPTLYLLDDQKRIIAKNLDVPGIDQVLDVKLKRQGKK